MIHRSFVCLFADLHEITNITGKITLPMSSAKNDGPGGSFLEASVYLTFLENCVRYSQIPCKCMVLFAKM